MTMKKHEVVQEPPASCCHGHVVDDDEVEYKDTDNKIDGDYDIESSSLPISNPEVSCCGGDGSAGMNWYFTSIIIIFHDIFYSSACLLRFLFTYICDISS